MSPVITWLIFVLLVSLFGLIKPNAARIFLGFFFLAMAIGVNVVMGLTDPPSYVKMGQNALIPFYRWVFSNIISLNPALFVLPVAAFQITIALLMLHKGKYVKWGLLGGIIFLIGIAPLGVESLPNLILAAAMAWLLKKDYPLSVWAMIRNLISPQRP